MKSKRVNPCKALSIMPGIEEDPRDLEIVFIINTFAISEFILI